MTEDVAFIEGLQGFDYGPNFVAIRKADLPGIYQAPGAAPEWRYRGKIPADKGWYTKEDFSAAFSERAER